MSQLRVRLHQSSFGPAIDVRSFATPVGYLVRLPKTPGVLPLTVHRSYCYTALNGNMVCSDTSALLFFSSSLTGRSCPTHRQRLFAFHPKRRKQLDYHRVLVDHRSRRPSCWYVICSPTRLLPVLTTCCLGLSYSMRCCLYRVAPLVFATHRRHTDRLPRLLPRCYPDPNRVRYRHCSLCLLQEPDGQSRFRRRHHHRTRHVRPVCDLQSCADVFRQGFWLTFTSMLLLFLAGCTVCCGRRRDRMASATTAAPRSKPSFFSRFRRNRV